MRNSMLTSSALCGLFGLSALAAAQGRFTNFETPQTHPIEVASVSGTDYVLVCNTPDNSVEIYLAAAPFTFVKRVPVGLGPGTVRWNAALGRFYACNLDGDSVTVVRLTGSGATPSSPVIERTVAVGDEPGDVAFNPENDELLVTLSTQSKAAWLKALGLDPVDPSKPTFILDASYTPLDPFSPGSQAVKAPRQIAWLDFANNNLDAIYALNLRGGAPAVAGEYDVGLWRLNNPADPSSPTASRSVLGGLGTTNHAFAVNSAGTRMFVVGTKAKNHGNAGIFLVSQLQTGFVQSWLMVVDLNPLTVRAEAPIGPAVGFDWPLFRSINLNRKYTNPVLEEVSTHAALVQPTDILLIESGGAVSKIVLAAFHSDRVAILTPAASSPGGYSFQRVNIPLLDDPGTTEDDAYSVVGPRGLARSAATGLVYVNGRLDNSMHVIDPSTATVVHSVRLQIDPTPDEIREGRKFLYSNRFSIDDSTTPLKGGMVSCASCHVDGRTDVLAWDLGDPDRGDFIPREFHDMENLGTLRFNSDKGRMMTQSLQGLINYPLNETLQYASTNAPYYWRGARRGPDNVEEPFKELTEAFDDFNEAFVKLQMMDDIDPDPNITKGITDAEMRSYRLFINTIAVPPNPEQPHSRVTEGPLPVDPNSPNPLPEDYPNPPNNPEAKLGMILYHNFPAVSGLIGRSCVDCHNLPDGSSSTGTLSFPGVNLAGTDEQAGRLGTMQITETAALRNLVQREMFLVQGFGNNPTHIVGNTGLLHPGTPIFDNVINNQPPVIDTSGPEPVVIDGVLAQSFNGFNQVFRPGMPGDVSQDVGQIAAVTEFVRQLDTGIAPAAGDAYTLDPADPTGSDAILQGLEAQVNDANTGLAVRDLNLGDGYWFDITVSPPSYRLEGTSTLLTRSQVIGLVDVVVQATPLGTDRRWASASGTPTLLTGPDPTDLILEPMVPNTAYVDVNLLDRNLNLGVLNSVHPVVLHSTVWALRTFQTSVVGPAFGVPTLRHEPPRRFRIKGNDIRPGAKLILEMAKATPKSEPTESMVMDLYPVRLASGLLVWETFVELDALHTFALLNGGYFAPRVAHVLLRDIDEFDTLPPTPPPPALNPPLDPNGWNFYRITVKNEDGTFTTEPIWQRLTVQGAR